MGKVSGKISRIFYPPGVTHLNSTVATALFLILFSTQLTLTTPFSYLPAMVASFGYNEKERGYYAGMIASSLFVGRFLGGYFWGWLTDKIGRRPVLLISALLTYVATLAFGFTTGIYWAIVTRFLQGLFNGVIVVGRAAFAEICDSTNQAIGVSLVFAAWNSAIVMGPAFGGFLATPVIKYPNVFKGVSKRFFTKFAFLLPSALISIILMLSIILIFFKFDETIKRADLLDDTKMQESQGLLSEEMTEINSLNKKKVEKSQTDQKCCNIKKWSIVELCSDKYVVLIIIMFGISGFCIIGFSELSALWMATSLNYGGLSFDTDKIGIALLVPAVLSVVLQPILFSRLERRFGGILTLQATILILVATTAMFPFIRIFHSNKGIMWFLLIFVGLLRMIADISSRSCIALFINNSVYSDQVGRVNGLAFSVQEIMRVASPTMFGSLFAWSINDIYHQVKFPIDYRLAFFAIAFFTLIILLLSFLLPKSINGPKAPPTSSTEVIDRS
ncbi:uncharacterized protein LOC101237218 isoform X1 [Hydra vulgaris]|uniref:uncharacterized protein LOC101237218 isoform X1 n=1 Tax=Hydra vulgaris TaxID=6087 RepID=UPI001F5FD378|nr:probable peptide/nitrate transporter At3g43790 isoform X1 [Hydra vulgaris]